ncbi:class I SAM-dependent methyltransferase [Cerasicoccus fimbriatus]|uniref:class I SAM-dependent methyltransferase n=1 Tax=Cerasicoccus fimbriatus TaxID=3014554 RepID=UPI0022B54C4A|nr:class I SAM-dependent methyltransferase [Cerasicoccus sp. TK19100]
MSVLKKSYDKHGNHYNQSASENLDGWLRTDTADHWRYERKYELVNAFSHHPDWTWVTVGDGRLGLDSVNIKKRGINSVLPTDIADSLLIKAKAEGLIEEYSCENAENLSFEDESFDVAYCKESYHHFPRPTIALYEMLRVARRAVILVEPRDYMIDGSKYHPRGPKGLMKDFIKWIRARLNLPEKEIPLSQRYNFGDEASYEEVGNYIFTISSREIEKIALGLNLPAVAFKGLNDYYDPILGSEPKDDSSELFREMKERIKDADEKVAAGYGTTSMLMAIIFKQSPDAQTREYLSKTEWVLKDLPRNPHLK